MNSRDMLNLIATTALGTLAAVVVKDAYKVWTYGGDAGPWIVTRKGLYQYSDNDREWQLKTMALETMEVQWCQQAARVRV